MVVISSFEANELIQSIRDIYTYFKQMIRHVRAQKPEAMKADFVRIRTVCKGQTMEYTGERRIFHKETLRYDLRISQCK